MKAKLTALDRADGSIVFSVPITKEPIYFEARRLAMIERDESGIGRHQLTSNGANQLLKAMDIKTEKKFDFLLVITEY
jgi:hypothetical protein